MKKWHVLNMDNLEISLTWGKVKEEDKSHGWAGSRKIIFFDNILDEEDQETKEEKEFVKNALLFVQRVADAMNKAKIKPVK